MSPTPGGREMRQFAVRVVIAVLAVGAFGLANLILITRQEPVPGEVAAASREAGVSSPSRLGDEGSVREGSVREGSLRPDPARGIDRVKVDPESLVTVLSTDRRAGTPMVSDPHGSTTLRDSGGTGGAAADGEVIYDSAYDKGNAYDNGHGNGNAYGHGNGNAYGHGNGNAYGHGNGNAYGHGNPDGPQKPT